MIKGETSARRKVQQCLDF